MTLSQKYQPPVRVATPPGKPLLIFDGDCGFCRHWIERWKRITGEQVEYVPYQSEEGAPRYPEIDPAEFEKAVQLVEPDGRVYSGAAAVFRALAHKPRWGVFYRAYERVPGIAPATEAAYAVVARNRMFFSFLTRKLFAPHPLRYGGVRSVFLRSLGLVYLIAFVSLWIQLPGLIGSNGILPARDLIRMAGEQLTGAERFLQMPTLCWFGASDSFLNFLCGTGTVLSAFLILGAFPLAALILLWTIYLSLTNVSGVFLSYQWDALLLETGLLAILFAPLGGRLKAGEEPSRIALWLLRWLLFRLMFQSGCVKLLSGDETWRGASALQFHYETQPLPTWIGWHAHQLPDAFHSGSNWLVLIIELAIPFFVLGPRGLRMIAFWIFVVFQALIALTGNYGYFNLLAAVLCIPLLDDSALGRFVPRWRRVFAGNEAGWRQDAGVQAGAVEVSGSGGSGEWKSKVSGRNWPSWILWPAVCGVIFVTVLQLIGMAGRNGPMPPAIERVYSWQQPFRSINRYGLFAVMTTNRPEIIVEGSMDGETWRAYRFKFKPDGEMDRPRFVAPHQPRLDWQMWFAALGTVRQNPWFVSFCVRLLQGSPEVAALLADNPFSDGPPRYIRALLVESRFSDPSVRRATGQWWEWKGERLYCPPITLPSEAGVPKNSVFVTSP